MATNDKTVVALYDDSASARAVIEQLETAGIPRSSISTMGSGLETVSNTLGGNALRGTDRVGELTRLGVPENDAELYAEGVRAVEARWSPHPYHTTGCQATPCWRDMPGRYRPSWDCIPREWLERA